MEALAITPPLSSRTVPFSWATLALTCARAVWAWVSKVPTTKKASKRERSLMTHSFSRVFAAPCTGLLALKIGLVLILPVSLGQAFNRSVVRISAQHGADLNLLLRFEARNLQQAPLLAPQQQRGWRSLQEQAEFLCCGSELRKELG